MINTVEMAQGYKKLKVEKNQLEIKDLSSILM